ncbi:MAG: hypothetical protein AB9882_02520 [Ignavibacteriaceae bacterium]
MQTREGYYSERNRDESYVNILDKLGSRQKAVYDIIKDNEPISNEAIAEILDIYPHQVSPRVLELRELGLVEYAGDEKLDMKRTRSLWQLTEPQTQLSLFRS